MTTTLSKLSAAFVLTALTLVAPPISSPAVQAISPDIVISQVYGGGGNSGAPLTNDYIELFNRGTAPVPLSGWSVQYASATGTGHFAANVTSLTGTLGPGQYYLVQQAAGATPSGALPAPDATGSTMMAAGAGKVIVANTTTGLACNGGSTLCSAAQLAQIVDLVGYGNANFFEGSGAAPTLSNTTAGLRNSGGCVDTDNNSADFAAGTPTPRNTASPLNPCGVVARNLSVNDVSAIEGNSGTTTFTFTVSLSSAAGTGGVTFDIGTADGTASAGSGDYVANTLTGQTIPEGSSSYTFSVVVSGDAEVEPDETFLVNVTNVTGATVTDGQGQGTIQTDDFPLVAIHDIQGAAHLSPHAGERVQTTPAVVTAVRRGSGLGFYIQDLAPDADVATSEGLFVFTSSTPTVSVGDTVQVIGTVTEFGTSPNLTLTELSSPVVTVLPDDNPLPSATVIGAGGRVPPTTVIDNDSPTRIDITTAGSFDADEDGVDFYESLEGMLVQVNDVTASGPTSNFGTNSEIPVVDAAAGVDTPRGGVIIRPTDFNPERVILNDWILDGPRLPDIHVGASITGATVGVIDYSFSNFKLQVTSLGLVTSTLTREIADAPEPGELAVASFNVENLAPGDPQAKFDELADLIIGNLQAPDLIAVEEIQDNNGAGGGGGVAADLTYAKLIEAIQTAGGPTYQFRQIDPVNGQDGGAPGGNIRQGFLFRTDRGLSFVDRPGGGSTTAVTVQPGVTGPRLSVSPGRIDPTNPAFTASRKPLVGEFRYGGRTLFIVANHFNSKGGDEPLFGRFQPPALVTEAQRIQQATVVANFVDSVEALDSTAGVIVLGDLNDFEFSAPMAVLKAAGLKPLIETLPADERYTYVFQGNSQSLDHIMMNAPLLSRPFEYDSVHVNAEFADQASDHDPQLVLVRPVFDFDGFFLPVDNPPTANTVKAGQAIPVRFSLDGDQGLNVIAAGYPTSNQVPCAGGAGDPVEETDTGGSSGLHYDAATDEYTYVWKTQKSWAGTCRVLTVKLSDGTIHEALFQFTR